jgi:hypothetical protein
MTSWQAFHLFYARPEHADRLATDVARILRSLTDRHDDWFFIRYAEGGPHLRIRVGSGALSVYERLRERATAECARLADEGADADWIASVRYADRDGRYFDPGTQAEIAYEPETERYGGPHALVENERLFRVSTAIAIRAVELTGPDLQKRARLAIDLMLVSAAAAECCGWSPGAFFDHYARGWRDGFPGWMQPAVDALPDDGRLAERFANHVDFVRSGRPADSLTTHWGVAIVEACRAFAAMDRDGRLWSPMHGRPPADDAERSKAIAGMIYSQLHMMNNRLGFAPAIEVVWSEGLATHLGGPAASPGFVRDELAPSLGIDRAGVAFGPER